MQRAPARAPPRRLALAEEHDLSEHWASSLSLAVRGQLLERADDPEAADESFSRATELARRGVASIEIAYSLLALAEHPPAARPPRRGAADLRGGPEGSGQV